VAGSCGCGDEPLGSIKFGEFLDWLKNCRLLRKDSAHRAGLFIILLPFVLDYHTRVLSYTCSITFDFLMCACFGY